MTITPFRYPGAKNKMLPILMEHLDPMLATSNKFIDVFVGGGSVLLEVASKYPKIQLFANDKDYWISSFWNVVSNPNDHDFNSLLKLLEQKPTLDLFYKLRETLTLDKVECAYKAIFFNRTAFSGILASGPIGGKDQKSKYTIDCRYNENKLKNKLRECRSLLVGRTTINNEDYSYYEQLTKSNDPCYLDPPYYVKGEALYTFSMSPKEHIALSIILGSRKNWLLSYDDCKEIKDLYATNHEIIDLAARYSINGKKSSWEKKNELIIK